MTWSGMACSSQPKQESLPGHLRSARDHGTAELAGATRTDHTDTIRSPASNAAAWGWVGRPDGEGLPAAACRTHAAVNDGKIKRNPCRIKGACDHGAADRSTATVAQVYALAERMPD